jgi:hypothetical protein
LVKVDLTEILNSSALAEKLQLIEQRPVSADRGFFQVAILHVEQEFLDGLINCG